MNTKLFYENDNPREYVSLVPTSAHTGDGIGNLIALICTLTQTMLTKRIAYCDELQATVMEVGHIWGELPLFTSGVGDAASVHVRCGGRCLCSRQVWETLPLFTSGVGVTTSVHVSHLVASCRFVSKVKPQRCICVGVITAIVVVAMDVVYAGRTVWWWCFISWTFVCWSLHRLICTASMAAYLSCCA